MKKILFLPLDERPCNYKFPLKLPLNGYTLIMPPKDILGDKKIKGDINRIREFLVENIAACDSVILSVDMLLYGGIVPSRLHKLNKEQLKTGIEFIEKLRAMRSDIKIYAFQLIMRCPSYSSSDEEPDYYELCGKEIHLLGRLSHLEEVRALTEQEQIVKKNLERAIDKTYLDDYLERRRVNLYALECSLELVKNGAIDYFVIPQDDAAEYGYTALDQKRLRQIISDGALNMKVSMYPGADEVGLTLLSRTLVDFVGKKPKIYVHYASVFGGSVVPAFEDRAIDETIKCQIYAAGAIRVYSLTEADILLAVNVGNTMDNITHYGEYYATFAVNRNLCEFAEYLKYAMEIGKAVAVADVAIPNGSDKELVKLLINEELILKINSYAGWNTSSNTLGTAICQCIASIYAPDSDKNLSFTYLRLLEDYCYSVFVRKLVTDQVLPKLNMNYFKVDGHSGKAAEIVKENIMLSAKQNFTPELFDKIEDIFVNMPWSRMFEADIDVKLKKQ